MAYKLMKLVILRGNMDKQQLRDKLDIYLAFDRITAAEYQELSRLLDSTEDGKA